MHSLILYTAAWCFFYFHVIYVVCVHCLIAQLQNCFKDGAIVVLISEASGKTLRVMQDGNVEGRGGEGQLGKCQCYHVL